MSSLIVETTAPDTLPAFSGPTDDLLAFFSFAAAERYGSTHPLSAVARLLRKAHGIDTRPLWDFDAAEAEDEEDRAELERIWQEPGPLASCCAAAATAIRADRQVASLARDFPALADRLDELAGMARRAELRGARVRVTYRL